MSVDATTQFADASVPAPHGLAKPRPAEKLFGLAVDFDSPDAVLEAAVKVAAAGYTKAEAYTPFAIVGLAEILGMKRTYIAPLVGLGAFCGAVGGFVMQYFANVIHYPWNIGGKPLNSWPMWIPITFECGILGAGVTGVISMLVLNKLPQLYHPMFRLPEFARASRDRFFLCIEANDAKFDAVQTREFLESLKPLSIMEVPR